ncbi:sugar ABC transporter substrate-binding protein [Paenibacillus psychroresistens]|uniref:Sugar ABC transporter substrate-binding protein n=1 Tax=Paenibacillus psychroresistens TaxID=1778678 RepID=A0A6B8RNA9_9BACL|nr:sugar ABC transporter substrate-binding protein [Paenibacillus psychroresistens]QGQ97519.1 sugar ABC transporter substrate-binding protein [Paenibacillus psychroresistens]
MKKANRMKMVLSLSLASVLVLSACGKTAETVETETPGASTQPVQTEAPVESAKASAEPVKLLFAVNGEGPTYELYKKMIQSYEDKHPNVTIETQAITQDYSTAILTRIAGGNAPDVFWMSNESVISYAARSALLELNPYDGKYFKKDDFMENALSAYTLNDKIYGLPGDSAGNLLFYNKEIFDKAKVPYPTANISWADLEKLAKQLTIKEGNTVSQFGYATDIDWFYWMPFLAMAGGSILDETGTKSVVNSPENAKAFNFIRDLMVKDHVAPTMAELKTTPGSQLFQTGKAAMYFGGAWNISSTFRQENLKWDMVSPPMDVNKGNVLGLGGFAIAKNTKHPDEAAEFLSYFSGEEAQTIKMEGGFAGSPTVKSLISSPVATKGFENPFDTTIHLSEIGESLKVAVTAPKSAHWSEVSTEMAKNLELFWLNKQDIGTTLKIVDEKISAILQNK